MIYIGNHLTGFYMRATLALNGLTVVVYAMLHRFLIQTYSSVSNTAQKMMFSSKDFFSKCD